MALFGSFETERETYGGPVYSVFIAKKQGDPKTEYAVKLFHPPPTSELMESEEEAARRRSDYEKTCLERIRLQKTAAESSNYVSPILESGQDERGVWYVTSFFPRSVNRIVSGKVALNKEVVHHILCSIGFGALDIRRSCGRSHGDIQSTNVQISLSDKLVDAKVVLSDPLAGGPEEAQKFEISDLRSVGRILLQLVLRRTVTDDELKILPVLSSPDWTRLFGKDSERWLSLCNTLLGSNAVPGKFTLENLGDELQQLRPAPPVSQKAIVVIATGVVLVLLALIYFLAGSSKGSLLVTTDPPGVEIKLERDGKLVSYGKTDAESKTLRVKSVAKGKYKLHAVYPGLVEKIDEVTIESGKTAEKKYAFDYGVVKINSKPTNAIVKLENKAVGVTPYTSPCLAPGLRTYSLELSNYQCEQIVLTVKGFGHTISEEKQLRALTASESVVDFDSQPSGATNYEGAKLLGFAPFRYALTAGTHTITVRYLDWKPITTNIMVKDKSNEPYEFRFPYGTAIFHVTPENSEVFLNRKPAGRDISRKVLQPDHYAALIRHPGYRDWTNEFQIADGTTNYVNAELEQIMGAVEITTDPPGASIYEASSPGSELGITQTNEPFRKSFRPGTYSFFATYDGLDKVETKAVQIAMGTNVVIPMTFKYGRIKFDSLPDGAGVTINGRAAGTTPYVYLQKPGPVTYRVALLDYYPDEGSVNLSAKDSIIIMSKFRPLNVSVALSTDPPGAQLFEGNAELAGSSGKFVLPWGKHEIRATYRGLAGLPELDAVTKEVNVSKDGSTSEKFVFKYGGIELTNDEPDANLYFQNNRISALPVKMLLRPEVPHDFVLEIAEFRTNLQFKVTAGQWQVPQIVLPAIRREYTNSAGMVFVRVSPKLYVGKFELAQDEYRRVPGGVPIPGDPRQPMFNVKFSDSLAFCERLTQLDQGSLSLKHLAGWTYDIPNEAEWVSFALTDTDQLRESVFSDRGLQSPALIDPSRKSYNNYRIYDLFGNVSEWGRGQNGQPTITGGSIFNRKPKPMFTSGLKSSIDRNPPADSITNGSPNIGFRCVLRAP